MKNVTKKPLCLLLAACLLAACSAPQTNETPASEAQTSEAPETQNTEASAASQPTETASGKFAAGTYTGTGTGMGGDLQAEVTLDENGITDIRITSHSETYGVGYGMKTSPIETMPGEIVKNQSLLVDMVSGATVTSNAVLTAVKDALTAAGASEDDFAAEIPKAEIQTEYTADVAVLGGGAAGLSAAIAAAEAGANVILLEKEGITGGSTTVSGGKVLAAGTVYQEQQDITDSPDALYDYMLSLGNASDEATVRRFADQSAGAVDWLAEHGVVFTDVERTHASIPTWRVHNVKDGGWMLNGKGGSITVPLTEAAEAAGVQILYNTPAASLILTDGKVTGVKADCQGTEVTVQAGAVIIATGGFANNPEMTAETMGTYALFNGMVISSAGTGNTGDGIRMAQEAGAQTDISAGGSVTYLNFATGIGIGEEAGLIVSEAGKRLCNEYSYQYVLSAELAKADCSRAFYITDADDPHPSVQYGISQGMGISAESVDELADQTGIDAAVLKETLDRYNASCQNGKDEEFGKPADFLNEITGTIYAFEMNASVSFTFGGIKTTTDAEVVDQNDTPIPGLYAAGEAAFYELLGPEKGVNYPSCGTAIGCDVVFGRIAGENAANAE